MGKCCSTSKQTGVNLGKVVRIKVSKQSKNQKMESNGDKLNHSISKGMCKNLISSKLNQKYAVDSSSDAPSMIITEQEISQVFKFLEKIGSGFSGEVHKAELINKKSDNLKFAIKSIDKSKLSSLGLKSIYPEILALSALDHPNIVRYFESYRSDTHYHIVTEYLSGGELTSGSITNEFQLGDLMYKLFSAINLCHSKGIMHRDIKPKNIIFESSMETAEIKLIDFGVANLGLVEGNSRRNSIVGTPYFMAPEIFHGQYTNKIDIYGLGVLMYVLLTGKTPFKGKTKEEIFNKVIQDDIPYPKGAYEIMPEGISFIFRLMSKDPAERPSAKECMENLWFNLLKAKLKGTSLSALYSYSFELSNNMIENHEELDYVKETMKKNLEILVSAKYFSFLVRLLVVKTLKVSDFKWVVELFYRFQVPGIGMIKASKLKEILNNKSNPMVSPMKPIKPISNFKSSMAFRVNERLNKMNRHDKHRNSITMSREVQKNLMDDLVSNFIDDIFQDEVLSFSEFMLLLLNDSVITSSERLLEVFNMLDKPKRGFLSFDSIVRGFGIYMRKYLSAPMDKEKFVNSLHEVDIVETTRLSFDKFSEIIS